MRYSPRIAEVCGVLAGVRTCALVKHPLSVYLSANRGHRFGYAHLSLLVETHGLEGRAKLLESTVRILAVQSDS